MTFEDDFTAAVRRAAKQKQASDLAESEAINHNRARVLAKKNAFLRVVVDNGPRRYDMGPDTDPDGLMVTLRPDPK